MKSKVGLLHSSRYLDHQTGPGHPESPQRLTAVPDHLSSAEIGKQLIFLQGVL